MKAIALFVGLWLAALASAQEGGGGGGGGGMEQVNPIRKNAVIAHGTIMGFAFAFLFPMGAIIIRTSTLRGLIWIHAGIQAFAWLLALTGLALGVYIAIYPDSQFKASNGHPIIGIIVIGSLAFQPITGYIHHLIYKKDKKRTFWAPLHAGWGRIFVTVGIINAGLGLELSGNTVKGEIAYAVIAGVIWVIWLVVVIWSTIKDGKGKSETGEKAYGYRKSITYSDNGPESREMANV
ncbi:hypothetical protein ABVK25_005256 [Lepraria finkii]|uniref:Cytochrome b561 domain-containing protein n=1 Tax=Lepraria finkii TaxID=1340010 RepID=A0ABR4B9G8_9LECA